MTIRKNNMLDLDEDDDDGVVLGNEESLEHDDQNWGVDKDE